ncbi:hypothetical protein GCM10010507_35420 [Streptomyces cinnamoneus]|uniref:Uncharacterized protein n=1 Tax=Streptomyces cinnamoneus TaxID=53446 RepID=A0A918TTG8_STRCJ|nr:hypothetical protein GCM10010507_35420 [Streptomyces cinnamoneus]
MYGKPALGTVLPLAGLTAAPEVMPGIPFARGLQEAAGAGFLLYCAIAAALLSAKFWYVLRNSGDRS